MCTVTSYFKLPGSMLSVIFAVVSHLVVSFSLSYFMWLSSQTCCSIDCSRFDLGLLGFASVSVIPSVIFMLSAMLENPQLQIPLQRVNH